MSWSVRSNKCLRNKLDIVWLNNLLPVSAEPFHSCLCFVCQSEEKIRDMFDLAWGFVSSQTLKLTLIRIRSVISSRLSSSTFPGTLPPAINPIFTFIHACWVKYMPSAVCPNTETISTAVVTQRFSHSTSNCSLMFPCYSLQTSSANWSVLSLAGPDHISGLWTCSRNRW